MSTIHNEKWDSTTAPAVASGWNFTSGDFETVTAPHAGSATPISSPNMLQLLAGGGDAAITWGTPDANSGDVQLTGSGLCDVAFGFRYFSVFYRCSDATLNPASSSYYEARLDWNAGTLTLYANVAGTLTSLASVSSITTSAGVWYIIGPAASGASHGVSLQRLSDGYYWVSGAWQSASGAAIAKTDSSISGSGYAGLIGYTGLSSDVYFDDWGFATFGSAASTLSAVGAPDVFAGSGAFAASASISATGGSDSFTGAASFRTTASVAATGGFDNFAASAVSQDAGVLAQTLRNDTFIAGGVFTDPAAMAATERPDIPSIFADVSPHILATEAHDVFAGSATAGVEPPGAMASTGGDDTFAGTAGFTYDAPASLVVTERGDVFSGSVLQASSGTLAAIERGDVFAAPGIVVAAATLDATESGDTLAGGQQTVAYHVYANTGAGDPIDYDSPIASTLTTSYTTSPLAYPGTWSFGVRAYYTLSGLEEQNLDCAITFVLSASGQDISNMPSPPSALRALALAAGAVRVEWAYPPTTGTKAPTGFHVYIGTGGEPNYASPATVSVPGITGTGTAVPYGSGRAGGFVADLSGLTNGASYTVGVRAYNGTAEESNTNTAAVTADATGPSAVGGLTASATS